MTASTVPKTAAADTKPPAPSATDDPDEVDISQHYYAPASRNTTPAQQQARDYAALQRFDPFTGLPNGQVPGAPPNAQMDQDPMLQMLQAMMGGAAGSGPGFPGAGLGPGGNPEGLPPGFADLLGAMTGGGPMPGQQEQAQQASSSAYIWRIIHALFSLGLGIYVALGSNFSGSAYARTHPPESSFADAAHLHHQTVGQRLFYLFATFEVLLQSSRYFLEKGQLAGSGWLVSLGRLLPEPYGGYVRVVGRYSMIYTTVVADAMVVIFVLGLVAWWKGGAA